MYAVADKGLCDWVGRVEEGDRKEFEGVSVHEVGRLSAECERRKGHSLTPVQLRWLGIVVECDKLFEIRKWKDLLH